MFPCFRVCVTWRGGIAIDWVTQRSRFWQKYLGLMYSQATVRSYTRIELCCVGTTPLKGGGYKVDKKPTHRNTSCGNLRRPHWTKTLTVWCCLLLRVAAFLRAHTPGDRVRPLWWKGYRPRVRPTWEPKGTKRT